MFHFGRAWVLERLGRYPEAVTEALQARSTLTNSPYFLGTVGFAYARGGDAANARKVLAELDGWEKRGFAVCADAALVHVGLREYDAALDQYEEALAKGEVLQDLPCDPTLDDLRPLPRFQALLQKLGLGKP